MTIANTDSATGDRGAATEREKLLRALTLAFGRGRSPEEAQRLAESRLRANEAEEAAYAERVAQRQREMAAAASPELERGADQRRQGGEDGPGPARPAPESPSPPPAGQRPHPQGARRQHSQSASKGKRSEGHHGPSSREHGARRQHGPSRGGVRQQERQEAGHPTHADLGAALTRFVDTFHDVVDKNTPTTPQRQRLFLEGLFMLAVAARTRKREVAMSVRDVAQAPGVQASRQTAAQNIKELAVIVGWQTQPARAVGDRGRVRGGNWDRYAARYRVVPDGAVGHGDLTWSEGHSSRSEVQAKDAVGHGDLTHLSFGEGGSASPPGGSEASPPGPQGQGPGQGQGLAVEAASASSSDPQRPLRGRKGRGSSASGPTRRPSATAPDGPQDSLRESRNIRPIRPGQDDWFCCTQCPYEGTARANAGGYAVCPKCRSAMVSSLDGWRRMAPPGRPAPASIRRSA